MIDAKRFKLMLCWNGKGVLIQQEQNRMGVLISDIPELVNKLTEFYAHQNTEKA